MLLSLIVTIVVLGLLYWVVTLLPIPEPFLRIVQVLFIILAVLALLEGLFGVHLLGNSLLLNVHTN